METIFRIPDADFVRGTRALERGDADALAALRRPTPARYDHELAARLVGHALERPWTDKSACDAWLAPRVHAVLRLPRRIAADRGVWFWLATTVFKPYVEWRFPRTKRDSPWWRYDGDLLRNGVSRLWWGAEMVRNGPDYRLVPHAFRSVRTFMFVSELRYSWYREAARAFARVAAGVDGKGAPMGADVAPMDDKPINRLSVLFNTYLSLDVLESHGALTPGSTKPDWDATWAETPPTWLELSGDVENLVGPDSGQSAAGREETLTAWLRRLASEIADEQPLEEAEAVLIDEA